MDPVKPGLNYTTVPAIQPGGQKMEPRYSDGDVVVMSAGTMDSAASTTDDALDGIPLTGRGLFYR